MEIDEADARTGAARQALIDWIQEVNERAQAAWKNREETPPLGGYFAVLPRWPIGVADLEIWDDLAKSSKLREWLDAAARDARIGSIHGLNGPERDRGLTELQTSARGLALDLVREGQPLDNERVRRQVDGFWSELSSQTERFELGGIVESIYLEPETEPIPLGRGIELRPVAGTWASERFIYADRIPRGSVAISAMVEMEATRNRSITDNSKRTLEYALLAHQLVRPRWPMVVDRFWRQLDGRKRAGPSGAFGPSDWRPAREWSRESHPHLWLTQEEVDKVRAVGAALTKTTPNFLRLPQSPLATSPKSLAFRSFTRTFERISREDVVLDCAIIFEALFSDNNQEMTHKIAMRSALLLAVGHTKARQLMLTMKKFYALRSKIVHAQPSDVSNAARDVLRAWDSEAVVPDSAEMRLAGAAARGQKLAAEVLRACVLLEAAGDQPFSKGFTSALDLLAFDAVERNNLQIRAGVSSPGESVGRVASD